MTDFSKNPHPTDDSKWDFTKPIKVKIVGKSPPMSGVDSIGGTTYIPDIHPIHEGKAVPLEREKPRRKTKRDKQAYEASHSPSQEAFFAHRTRIAGKVKKDKNLV